MTEHDEDPIEMMQGDAAPEHGATFWDQVQTGLDATGAARTSSNAGPNPGVSQSDDPTMVHAPVAGAPSLGATSDPTRVVPVVSAATPAVEPTSLTEVREARHGGSRGPFLAAAAAVLLVLGGVIGYLSLRDGGDSDQTDIAAPDVLPTATEIPDTLPIATTAPAATAVVLPTATAVAPTPVPTPAAFNLGQTPDQSISFWLQPDPDAETVCDGDSAGHRILVSQGPDGELAPSGTAKLFGEVKLATIGPDGTAFLSTCAGMLRSLEVGLEPQASGPFSRWASLEFGPEVLELRDLSFTSPTSMIGDALTSRTDPPGTETIEINLLTGQYLLPTIGIPADAVLIGATADGAYEYYINPTEAAGCEGVPASLVELLVKNAQGTVSSASSETFTSVIDFATDGQHVALIERCEESRSLYISPVAEDGSLPVLRWVETLPDGTIDSLQFNNRGELIVRGSFSVDASSYADGFILDPATTEILETFNGINPADDGAVPADELVPYNDGEPVATSRDGRFDYYFAEHISAQQTCEGANATLYAVDQRGWAAPAYIDGIGSSPVTIAAPGPGDRLALGISCEGQQADLWVVKVRTDGRLTIQEQYVLDGAGYVTAIEWDDETLHIRVFTSTRDDRTQEFDVNHDEGTVIEIDL